MWDKGDGVTLLIRSGSLVLMWFQKSKKTSSLIPRAWDIKEFDSYQVDHAVIFNPTFLAKTIIDFITAHAIKKSFVCIGLSETMIWERCCWLVKEQPTFDDIAHSKRSLVWNYTYVKSKEDKTEHFFYLFGLAREILFQYQLLALKLPFACRTITAKNRALLHVVSTLQELPSRQLSTVIPDQIQLLTDYCLTTCDAYGYEKFFEPSQQFYDFFQKEKEATMGSLGLFLLGKSYEFQ